MHTHSKPGVIELVRLILCLLAGITIKQGYLVHPGFYWLLLLLIPLLLLSFFAGSKRMQQTSSKK